ncbi:MAG: DUF421 domain-containing protein [Clostridia bacterium]|nr:DUF421 domain-containing protein [Clostridia bacterium]
MATIFIRIILIYVLLLGTMRVMGKRQIGELQPSELVTTILLSELAAQPIADSNIPLLFAVIPISALLSIEVLISFAVTKLPCLKPIFDGKPSILICRGKLQKNEIARVRISMEELLTQLRISGIADIADVYYAILEQNGQLSVIPKRAKTVPTAEDMSLSVPETGLAHAIIVDTHISDFDLSLIHRDRNWLDKRLRHHRISLNDVFLFTVDDTGKECIIKK